MKLRVEFNDGKTFSHYAFVVFKVGLKVTYIASGLLMFSLLFMNISNHFGEDIPEVLNELKRFYFSTEVSDCWNCDEID